MFRWVSILAAAILLSMFPVFSATNSSAEVDPKRFEPEMRKFEVVDQRNPAPQRAVLFTGSSSIRLWDTLSKDFPKHPVINRGFGGSHMSDLNFYFDRIVKPYRPSLIVVYEGDNDLAAGKSVDAVYADYLRFLKRVRTELPGTPVLLLAAKPSPSRTPLLGIQRDLDHRLQQLASTTPDIHFIDTFRPLVDADGNPRRELFRDDFLHMNAKGYALWRELIAPVLDRILSHSSVPIR
jgi:lysophospholipase L1-like esterase